MKAYISGSAGATVVRDNDSLICLFAYDPEEPKPISQDD